MLERCRFEAECVGFLPACGADDGVGSEDGAGFEVHGISVLESSDVVEYDADFSVADEVEEIGGVVVDRECVSDFKGASPGPQLLRLGMGVEFIQCNCVFTENVPKPGYHLPAQPRLVQEIA